VTAGRPEIAPALAAAWRHTRTEHAELRAWQDARLRRLVLHAYEAVPFYRRLFDRHRLHPRHIRGVVDLDLIPTTDKTEMRRRGPLDVLAKGHDPDALIALRSHGTTDVPFAVRRTWLEDMLQSLLRFRAYRDFGVRHRDRIVVVGVDGRPDAGLGRSLLVLGYEQKLVVDGRLDPVLVAAQLREAQPDVVVGLPSVLGRLAAPELAADVSAIRPRLVILGGEAAPPTIRLRIRETFAAPLREIYTSHEVPLLAWECRHSGDLHTSDDGVLVEVLRDGRPAEPGETGEVVVTNLHAYAMPFIRYRLGDLATRATPCGCGAPFAALTDIRKPAA
jgi:phenylacetate-CoA ligase